MLLRARGKFLSAAFEYKLNALSLLTAIIGFPFSYKPF